MPPPPLDYGAYSIEILAEINNAPKLSREAVRAAADYFRASGADVIDIGCTPGVPFPGLHDAVSDLRAAGFRISIDSFDPAEIRTAVAAGAELVLSVNGSNLEVARELAGGGTRVVVIPDFGEGLDTLDRNIEALERWGVALPDRPRHRADRVRVHGLARALCRGAPALSRRLSR